MSKIIDSAEMANQFGSAVRFRVEELRKTGVYPKLVTVSVGEKKCDPFYRKLRNESAQFTGVLMEEYCVDEKVSFQELYDLISKLNNDRSVHAILLQYPLPGTLSFRDTVNLISPEKDVDGLTTINQGRLFSGEPGVVSSIPLGVLHLLRSIYENIAGMNVVIMGRSSAVGRPLAQLLLNAGCTVTLLHSDSENLADICRKADILISAVGKCGFVNKELVKNGATLVDAGVGQDMNDSAQQVGDLDFEDVISRAGAIIRMPDGIAPLASVYLMQNTLKLACCY